MEEDPVNFDAPFFSLTKTEVLTLDPQQRLVLENVYHALENGQWNIDVVELTTDSDQPVFP